MKSKLILASGLISILMLNGCLAFPRTAKVRTLMPTKPTLEFVQCAPPATLCLDDANAAKLGVYIMELERVKK